MNKQVKGEAPAFWLTVGDLKQWFYCPRVVYFRYVRPVAKKVTYKMDFGREAHEREASLESRRTLRGLGLDGGERLFNLSLDSVRLGLRGVLDFAVRTQRDIYPVEVKNAASTRLALGHKYQLTAYAMLIEDAYGHPVCTGFLRYIPSGRVRKMRLTQGMKGFVKVTMSRIRRMVTKESFPDLPHQRGKCLGCEYRNFCGDV